MHTDGGRKRFGQPGGAMDGAGVEELDPPHILFRGTMRAEGMSDEVPGHTVE